MSLIQRGMEAQRAAAQAPGTPPADPAPAPAQAQAEPSAPAPAPAPALAPVTAPVPAAVAPAAGPSAVAPPSPKATIERFYAAFARLDGEAMQACYAADARFDDEAFSLRGRDQIGGMWRMLCGATREKGRDAWRLETRDITDHGAHWEAHYRFSATGRLVHNIIDAEIECGADGLIVQHRDRFDFWRWSRQALGAPGLLLGWSPFLRNKVRATAAGNLQKFLAAKRR